MFYLLSNYKSVKSGEESMISDNLAVKWVIKTIA